MLGVYSLWHLYHEKFPRLSKHTLGEKIDGLFTDIIELILAAGFASMEQKLPIVNRAIGKLDLLKAFIQIAWEVKCLDHKQFAALASPLNGIGKDIGGWRKDLQKKAPCA